MVEAHLTRDFNYPASKVWGLLENFGDINWAPGIDKIEIIGEGIGMIRRLHISGMDPIDEQLTAQDSAAMTFAYDIPRGIPLPVTNYSANAKVTVLDDNSCRVDWYGRAEPKGASDEDAIAMISGAYEMLLQWIDDWFSATSN